MTEPRDPHRPPRAPEPESISRRRFLQSAGSVAATGVLTSGILAAAPESRVEPLIDDDVERLSGEVEISLDINGAKQKLRVEPRTSLLNALRNHCDPPLTGTKEVCDRGQCGACTVIVDGKPAYSCLLLAVSQRGKVIRTIEGLGSPEHLSPLQEAFCAHDASMCGFCTSGFVMAITACLEQNPAADLPAIKRSCAGNVCRCGTYPHIFDAAVDAARTLAKGTGR